DFMMSYREHADKDTWPPDVEDDALEGFFRGTLALRASKRAKNGAAVVALLAGTRGATTKVTKRLTALETAETEAVMTPAQVSLSRDEPTRRPAPLGLGAGTGGVALFAGAFSLSFTPPPAAAPIGARDSQDAEEPPNGTELIPPSKRASSRLAPTP